MSANSVDIQTQHRNLEVEFSSVQKVLAEELPLGLSPNDEPHRESFEKIIYWRKTKSTCGRTGRKSLGLRVCTARMSSSIA